MRGILSVTRGVKRLCNNVGNKYHSLFSHCKYQLENKLDNIDFQPEMRLLTESINKRAFIYNNIYLRPFFQQMSSLSKKVHKLFSKPVHNFPGNKRDIPGGTPSNNSQGNQGNSYQSFIPQLLALTALTSLFFFFMDSTQKKTITYDVFVNQILAKNAVQEIKLSDTEAAIYTRTGQKFLLPIPSQKSFFLKLEEFRQNYDIPYRHIKISEINHLSIDIPVLIIGLWAAYSLLKKKSMMKLPDDFMTKMLPMQNKRTYESKPANKLHYKDIAGCDEAKLEIMEFVDYLKNPVKYTRLGAKVPRGALLTGPPGTGKTMLAIATAIEANVPFLSVAGSEFLEMFVGVGANRVRALFKEAREKAPCIVFIDEIDSIAKSRSDNRFRGGNDERESTLNQLLIEMDGFNTTDNIVVMAGTNRIDLLDNAILRPGRFDRHIFLDLPDIKGRYDISKIYLNNKILEGNIDDYSTKLSSLTPGLSGADISNIVNESAIIAARNNQSNITLKNLYDAVDRVIGGIEKKGKKLTKEELSIIAHHESGKAVLSWYLQYADPLLKISIIPRGKSNYGYSQYLTKENSLLTKEQLQHKIITLFGGKASVEVILNQDSTVSHEDIEKVNQLVKNMVVRFGMNDSVGLLCNLNNEYEKSVLGDKMRSLIDNEVKSILNSSFNTAKELSEKYKSQIKQLAELLLQKETITQDDVKAILGERQWK